MKFEVKWEGYNKKADRTWESKENLTENANDILEAYLEAHGGEEKILEDSEKGIKGKKRGRPPAGAAAAGKRRKADHPGNSTPPVSTKVWKPPAGSWEDDVDTIDACHDENSGKLIVYLTWKNGQKTQHETKVIYQRCPQKVSLGKTHMGQLYTPRKTTDASCIDAGLLRAPRQDSAVGRPTLTLGCN